MQKSKSLRPSAFFVHEAAEEPIQGRRHFCCEIETSARLLCLGQVLSKCRIATSLKCVPFAPNGSEFRLLSDPSNEFVTYSHIRSPQRYQLLWRWRKYAAIRGLPWPSSSVGYEKVMSVYLNSINCHNFPINPTSNSFALVLAILCQSYLDAMNCLRVHQLFSTTFARGGQRVTSSFKVCEE